MTVVGTSSTELRCRQDGAARRGGGLLQVAGPNSDIGLQGINARAQLGHTGGVLLALRLNFVCTEILGVLDDILIRHKVDCVGVKVQIPNVSINILVVYIPPATRVFGYSHFFEKLELCHIFDANFILAGDFNVPLLDNQIGPLSNCINNFMSFVEAIQINDVLNVNRRCLDLIFCPSSSSFTLKQSDFPLVPEDSHPPALVFNLNFSVEKV
jgi:hypothetical protein